MKKFSRSQTINLRLPSGSFVVAAPTRAQIRRCIELDVDEPELPSQAAQRRAHQVRILLDRSQGIPFDELTSAQEFEIFAAIAALHNGDGAKRPAKKQASLAEKLAMFDEQTASLAVHLHCTLEAADAQPYLDLKEA